MSATVPRIAGFMFHEVTDDPSSTGFQRPSARRYTITPDVFASHLDGLGRTPALITDLDLTRPGHHLVLTFDDGGRSALAAAEALARRGWRGHFFIVTARIGERTFLTAPQIRELRQAGHLVGSHSHTHPDIFRDLSRARLLQEWRTSAERLESVLGEPCVAASVPGGDASAEVFATAGEAGFRYLFTSEPHPEPQRFGEAGCWILGRVCVKAGTSPVTVARLARFQGWGRAQWNRRLKELVRRSLAPMYRAYVRRVTSVSGTRHQEDIELGARPRRR